MIRGMTTRLLFVTSFYPPLTGGGASRIHDFSRLLNSMGFEATVLTFLPFFKPPSKKEQIKGVKVVRLPSLGFKHPLDQIFTSLIGTLLICVSRNPAFIIVSVPPGEPCVGAFLACNILGKRIIVDVRDEWEDAVIKRTRRVFTRVLYRFYKRLFSSIYRKSKIVTTVTPTLVKRVKERCVEEVYLLPNGADVKLFHPISTEERSEARRKMKLQKDDFVIAYAGRVGWYYRIDVVIRALYTLVTGPQSRNLKLLVIGGGEKTGEYSTLSRQMRLEQNVFFLGERKHEEVANILPCCDVGIIPFDDDPIWLSAYTTKFFEYCASGLPTIVSIVSGADLEKLIIENDVGFVVEPMNSGKMAEVIWKAYNDRDYLERMRVNARKLVVEKFNREKIVAMFAVVLRTKV